MRLRSLLRPLFAVTVLLAAARCGDKNSGTSIVITGSGGGRWHSGVLAGAHVRPNSLYTDSQDRLLMSPDGRHLIVENNSNPLSFYPFHCQHLMLPSGSLCEFNGASHTLLRREVRNRIRSQPDVGHRRKQPARTCPSQTAPITAPLR